MEKDEENIAGEMLSNSTLESSYYLRKQQVRRIIAETYESANEIVDIGDITFLAIINSLTAMVWGQTFKDNQGANSEFRAVLGELMELLGKPNISDFLPLLARFDLQGIQRRATKVSCQCDEMLDSTVNVHHSKENDGKLQEFKGYLSQLTKREDPTQSLSMVQIKAMLADVIIGGMDTTVTTVEWVMARLLKHPEVMRTVQEELTEIVGLDNLAKEAHNPKLKYLKAVVKETLRLHPAFPLLFPHSPTKSTIVGGYTIPKGAQIFLNMFAIQRDPQLWDDPLEFKPERFLKGQCAMLDYLGNQHQYLPFGSGRRACPGIPLADRMSMHVLASLLHAFDWSLPSGVEDVDLTERYGIIVKKSKPLLALPSPRLSNLDLYSYSD